MPGPLTDAAAWGIVLSFAAAALVRPRSERAARAVAAAGWVAFAGFWLALVPHFAFAQQSYVEGIGSAVAVPACLYAGYRVWRDRPSLLVLSRAVAVMGLIYLPFVTIPALHALTVETVTRHAELAIRTLGYSPAVTAGDLGFRNTFVFTAASGHKYATPVLLACSGIGSISLISGIVLAVDAPRERKLRALAVVVPLIYALNIVRVVFIVLAHGRQWLRVFPEGVMLLFGETNPRLVSYLVADRVISQVASVVVLVLLTLWLLRRVPNLTSVVEEAVYVVTGREFDVGARFAAR